MRVLRTVPVPATIKQVLDYMKCELCENTSRSDDWSPSLYEVADPTVSLREGSNYPEGGSTTTVHIDICPNCFKEKLIPWFVAQGGSTRETNSNY
jgi:hypothetical protein